MISLEGRNPAATRKALREALARGEGPLRFPGALSPLVARLIREIGFEGVYLSGGALSAELGMPDVGLTTLSEVADRAGRLAVSTDLPVLVDADTGFGEALNVVRTVQELERRGVAGLHLEDQRNPKRCGHLGGKEVVEAAEMERKVRAAAGARQDPNLLLIARTDARAVEGIDAAIERAQAYIEAGADAIFPEALKDEDEFRRFRDAIDAPLLANMTEFGASPLLTRDALRDLGYEMVIYPVTTLRIAMGAVERGLKELFANGTQAHLVSGMQTRARLYELLDYDGHVARDADAYGGRENAE